MMFRQRLAVVLCGWLAASGGALAADGDPLRNGWALVVQRELLRWGIWYTGIHRVDDGALFGLVCCIVLTTFMVSALALMMFRTRGVNFTAGWLIGLPVCLAAMIVYCRVRPYPNVGDLASMFLFAGAAQLLVLTVGRAIKSTLREKIERAPAAQVQTLNLLRDQRMRLAATPVGKGAK